jgi:hypothetical protein
VGWWRSYLWHGIRNNPPQLFMPVAMLAQKGLFVDRVLAPELKDLQLARSQKGLGSVYIHPELLTGEAIEMYLGPLVASPAKKRQADAYAAALGTDVLVPVSEEFARWKGPARMVWATADPFFRSLLTVAVCQPGLARCGFFWTGKPPRPWCSAIRLQ